MSTPRARLCEAELEDEWASNVKGGGALTRQVAAGERRRQVVDVQPALDRASEDGVPAEIRLSGHARRDVEIDGPHGGVVVRGASHGGGRDNRRRSGRQRR